MARSSNYSAQNETTVQFRTKIAILSVKECGLEFDVTSSLVAFDLEKLYSRILLSILSNRFSNAY